MYYMSTQGVDEHKINVIIVTSYTWTCLFQEKGHTGRKAIFKNDDFFF